MRAVRKAVITAAGRGTRLYPATSVVQKAMMPLVDRDGLTKPTVQIIAEEAFNAGIEDICIVVSPGDESQFRQHFRAIAKEFLPSFAGKEWALRESDKLARMEESLTYVVQQTSEGFGHAVYQARDFVGDDAFLLLTGDHVYLSRESRSCARQLIERYNSLNADALSAVARMTDVDLHLVGTMRGQPLEGTDRAYRVAAIEEKPAIEYARKHLLTPGLPPGQYLCHFGMHAFPPTIFDCLEELIRDNRRSRGEVQLTSAQQLLLERSSGYYCSELDGERYDTGVPFGLMETQLALALTGVYRHEITESVARLLAQKLRSVSSAI